MATPRNPRVSPLVQAAGSKEFRDARQSSGWSELVRLGCDEGELGRRVTEVIEARWRDEPPEGRKLQSDLDALRKAATALEKLNGTMAVHTSLHARGSAAGGGMLDLAGRLYRTADQIEEAEPQQAGRKKPAGIMAKAALIAYVETAAGGFHDAATAEILGYAAANEDYSAQAHKVWRADHREDIERARKLARR